MEDNPPTNNHTPPINVKREGRAKEEVGKIKCSLDKARMCIIPQRNNIPNTKEEAEAITKVEDKVEEAVVVEAGARASLTQM